MGDKKVETPSGLYTVPTFWFIIKKSAGKCFDDKVENTLDFSCFPEYAPGRMSGKAIFQKSPVHLQFILLKSMLLLKQYDILLCEAVWC